MKSATLPSIRIEPDFRAEVESVLNEDETLSAFVETSVREALRRRQHQAAFIARGIQALETARQQNGYVDAEVVVKSLERKLEAAKKRKQVKTR